MTSIRPISGGDEVPVIEFVVPRRAPQTVHPVVMEPESSEDEWIESLAEKEQRRLPALEQALRNIRH